MFWFDLNEKSVPLNTAVHVDDSSRIAKAFGRTRSLSIVPPARLRKPAGNPMGSKRYRRHGSTAAGVQPSWSAMSPTLKPRADGQPKTTATATIATRASGAVVTNSSNANMSCKW
jgi:hypothetical protein